MSPLYQRIYACVSQIPPGRVVSYGAIAREVGCGARQVGYAMAALPAGHELPWQRVINSRGEVSPRVDGDGQLIQRKLLEAEGVEFDARGRTSFARFGWTIAGGCAAQE